MTKPAYVPASQLAGLLGFSIADLRAWQTANVLRSHAGENGTVPSLYTFRDAVGLRLLSLLKDRAPVEELRKIQPWLERNAGLPWERLRVSLHNHRLQFFEDSDSTNGVQSHDVTINVGDVARELSAKLARHGERGPDQIGRLERRRGVMGGAVVIAGTRIPPSAVWSFHEAGYDTDAIIEQYPSLKPEDVEAAIAYERQRHAQRTRKHRAA